MRNPSLEILTKIACYLEVGAADLLKALRAKKWGQPLPLPAIDRTKFCPNEAQDSLMTPITLTIQIILTTLNFLKH